MPQKTPRKRPVRRRPKLGRPNPIDMHVGGRVRLRRTILGLSQEKLGEKIGLTFQQVQKYERGANRIGASRLWELANVLDVPVQYFFAEMRDETTEEMRRIAAGQTDLELPARDSAEQEMLARREVLDLVRSYCRIVEPGIRHRLFELTKTLAEDFGPEEPERAA